MYDVCLGPGVPAGSVSQFVGIPSSGTQVDMIASS
jgi:hypothetical protein